MQPPRSCSTCEYPPVLHFECLSFHRMFYSLCLIPSFLSPLSLPDVPPLQATCLWPTLVQTLSLLSSSSPLLPPPGWTESTLSSERFLTVSALFSCFLSAFFSVSFLFSSLVWKWTFLLRNYEHLYIYCFYHFFPSLFLLSISDFNYQLWLQLLYFIVHLLSCVTDHFSRAIYTRIVVQQ